MERFVFTVDSSSGSSMSSLSSLSSVSSMACGTASLNIFRDFLLITDYRYLNGGDGSS